MNPSSNKIIVPSTAIQENKTLNVDQRKDNRKYEIQHNFISNSNNTTTITNNNSIRKGFFGFIIDMIALPFRIIYNSCRYIWIKYEVRKHIKADKVKRKWNKYVRKLLKQQKGLYDTSGGDEVY